MRKFDFVTITQPIDMGEYHEAYKGRFVHVWVNPPKAVRKEREELLRNYAEFFRMISTGDVRPFLGKPRLERLVSLFTGGLIKPREEKRLREVERKTFGWFAQLWSQHPDAESHWTVAEIEQVNEHDPALYKWLVQRSALMIDTFRADKKK